MFRHQPLIDAIAAQALRMIAEFPVSPLVDCSALHEFAYGLLVFVWSFSYLRALNGRLNAEFAWNLRATGRAVDTALRFDAEHILARLLARRRRPASEALRECQQVPPSLDADLAGMIVVSKPSGWEVDGATTDFNVFIG